MPIQPYTAPETPDLSILIVAWNVRDDLRACLQSIRSSVEDPPLRVEVIVVDSASADGTGEMIERDYPAVHYLPHAENIGFTRGNNLALQTARGRFLLLLNPDTLILGAALCLVEPR